MGFIQGSRMDIEGILPLIAMSEISLWNRHVCVTHDSSIGKVPEVSQITSFLDKYLFTTFLNDPEPLG